MIIMRVTRQQFAYLYSLHHPDNRRVIGGTTFSHFYNQRDNIMVVSDDDVEFAQYPPDDMNPTIARVVGECYKQAKSYGALEQPA